MYAIVYSIGDPAGAGAASKILSLVSSKPCSLPRAVECRELQGLNALLAGFSEDVVFFDFLDEVFAAYSVDVYIVLSRHSSASGEPTLSLHYPGNPTSKAEYGGRPRELSIAYPSLAKTILHAYHEEAMELKLLEEYNFTLEATHHGPTSLKKPVVFVEIGSTVKQWRDERAWTALAKAVIKTLRQGPSKNCKPVIGLGDTHYPRTHTKLMLTSNYCYGHILAKYVFNELDKGILIQAVEKSVDRIEAIVLQKVPSRIRKLAEEVASMYGLEVLKAKVPSGP